MRLFPVEVLAPLARRVLAPPGQEIPSRSEQSAQTNRYWLYNNGTIQKRY